MYQQKSRTRNRRFSTRNYAKSRQSNSQIQIFNLVKKLSPSWQACIPLACLIVLGWSYVAVAQAPAAGPTTAELKVALDTLWVAIAAFLVFFMNAGFGMLETGFVVRKMLLTFLPKT